MKKMHKQSQSSYNFYYLTECGYMGKNINMTTDNSQVNCKLCLRAMEKENERTTSS